MLGLIISLGMAGSWMVTADAMASNIRSGQPVASEKQATLSYVCGGRDGAVGSFVFTSPQHLGGKNGHSALREIEMQVDGARRLRTLWRYDDNKAVAAQPHSSAEMHKLLASGQMLTVRAIDQAGRTIEAQFNVADTVKQLDAAAAACAAPSPVLASITDER